MTLLWLEWPRVAEVLGFPLLKSMLHLRGREKRGEVELIYQTSHHRQLFRQDGNCQREEEDGEWVKYSNVNLCITCQCVFRSALPRKV